MIMFFTEQDLVSFGEYMISKEREKMITEHPTMSAEERSERLNNVTNMDLSNWMQLVTEILEMNEDKHSQ